MASNTGSYRDYTSKTKHHWMHAIPRKPVAQTRVIYSPVENPSQDIDTQPDETGRWEEPRRPPINHDNRLDDTNAITRTRAETYKTNDTSPDSLLKDAITLSVESTNGDKVIDDGRGTWRPKWLRPAVLGMFVCFFLFLTAALAIMLHYSRNNDGLFQVDQSLLHVYVWRFGPTAILTLLSILWARVELQAMMYMPWFALRWRQPDGGNALSLDYLSMLSPVVLIRSIREKHYLVSLVAIVSVILKVQIVLAPGLFSFTTINVPASVELHTHDSFALAMDSEAETQKDTSAWYMGMAIRNFDMLYPFGVTDKIAYQTFGTSSGNSRGTVDEPVIAVVDGVFTDLHCLQLAGYSITDQKPGELTTDLQVDLHFPGCDGPIRMEHRKLALNPVNGNVTYWAIESNRTRSCPGLAQDTPPFLYYGAVFKPTLTNSSLFRFESAGAVLCEPRTWLSKVQVTDDGVAPKVTLLQNQAKTPVLANMWSLIEYSVPRSQGEWNDQPSRYLSGPVRVAKVFNGEVFQPTDKEDPGIYSNEALYNSVMNLTRSIGPLLGHYRLRGEDDAVVLGSKLQSINRLAINQWTCLSMIALFFLAICISTFSVFRHKCQTSVWYRDPVTAFGNLIFLRDHPEFANGLFDPTAEKEKWDRCIFTPLVLRTWARLSFGLYALLLMAGLILTLRLSNSSGGLATIDEEGYLHITWTSVPASIALGVSLYISSCDWAYRDLGNLYRLSRKSCRTSELDASLLDMMGIRALYYSIRQKLWSVTCSQTLALICGVLTSLVSVLFAVEVIPESTIVQFQQQTVFSLREDIPYNDSYGLRQTQVAALLLRRGEANLTYPKNTFDDLVFPAFESTKSLDTSRNLTVTINTPALKVKPSCAEVPKDSYRLTFRNYTESGKTWFYSSYNEHTPCPSGQRVINITTEFPLGEASLFDRSYVATTVESIYDPEMVNFECKLNETNKNFTTEVHYTYVWGEYSVESIDFDWFSVWRCNYTWAEVDTEVNMIASDGEFIIDPENPPRPDLSNLRSLDTPLDLPPSSRSTGGIGLLPEVNLNDRQTIGISSSTALLVEPYGQLPKEAFGDPEQVGDILQRLHHNFAFSAAQLANTENRRSVADVLGTTSGALLSNATVVDRGRRRLVQDANVTYVVVGILGAVILVNVWAMISTVLRRRGSESWLLDMDVKGLAPDGWRSISSMAGLLDGSNASAHLPRAQSCCQRKRYTGRCLMSASAWGGSAGNGTRHGIIRLG
ncbi:hypothetical protein Ct61P_11813 [Colletotrichum tofieldiae]|nr:hypothetical protein Ct61P_11813 [Colletotrichum tofieldiae]